MGNVNTGLAILLSILGLVVLVASVTAFTRASFAKAQIDALRGDRDDLTARVTILEGEKDRLAIDLDKEKAKVAVLQDIAIGKDQLVRIEEAIKTHDEHVVAAVKRLEELILAK